MALVNLFIEVSANTRAAETIPLAVRFVPFALYAHHDDAQDLTDLWRRCFRLLAATLRELSSSETGAYYESRRSVSESFQVIKKSSVIVLGKYTEPEFSELITVRDYLRSKGYAHLLGELAEVPEMSLGQKAGVWTQASRFNIMIDRSPSGHIAEYEILKSQGAVLALFHPRGTGSTFMIGGDVVDVNFIREFEFEDSPLECMPAAVEWAESFVQAKVSSLGLRYPWRGT